ncbi:unnamed protein product [Litomosoides sigmodontis]|uniref:Anaphase-promoting complex subunit 11 n=1 Tax=Litomosoides sigmodontis TaxID=42156 RepID=A0A3P6UY18_LITSI|nr:unnamed protein product [Litomosoides sigmodontis]
MSSVFCAEGSLTVTSFDMVGPKLPVAYVLDTSNSSSQLSEGGDQNTLSSSSSSPSLTAALRNFEISSSNFDIDSNTAREHSRDAFIHSQDEPSAHMESYMEYLALLNHRHAQEPVNEISDAAGSDAAVATNESLSLLTNTTNSLSFGTISSANDENGDRNSDGSNRVTESENNNNDISGSSSTQELALIRDLYSPSAADPASSSERGESTQSESFANNTDETPRAANFRMPHLLRHNQNNSNESNSVENNTSSFQNRTCHDPSSVRLSPQPLKLPTSTRLKITVLKWNVAASWKWTVGDETCGICRMPFEACCIECKTPGDECPLALGTCKHAFHMHCIVKWIETQNAARPQCPLCRQEWKFAPR